MHGRDGERRREWEEGDIGRSIERDRLRDRERGRERERENDANSIFIIVIHDFVNSI